MAKLTPKQEAFCLYYIELMGNGTQAAIKAGYSERAARKIAHELITKPVIKQRISEAMNQKHSERFMSAQEVIERLSDRARLSEKDIDKIRALEILAKFHGLFSNQIQIITNANEKEYIAEWGQDNDSKSEE